MGRKRWGWLATLIIGCGTNSGTPDAGTGADANIDAAVIDAVVDAAPSGFAQRAYIKASNPGINHQFGWSVGLSDDGVTLAVGGRFEGSLATGINGVQTDSGSYAGAVYVFTRTGESWIQQAYIKASNTGGSDVFGSSVSLSSDGNTLAVGAPGESSAAVGVGGNQADDSRSGSGAVYVFRRTGVVWGQEAYVKASNTGGAFGQNLSISADGATLAVSAYGDGSIATGIDGNQASTSGGQFSGAVYVFERSATVWSQRAYVKASNTDAQDGFGGSFGQSGQPSVAISGDGSTLAVGAVGESSAATGINGNQADNSASGAGAVYVFVRSGSSWSQQAYVKASNAETDDRFGMGVALSTDGSTLVVSAIQEASSATGVGGSQADNSAPFSGAVYAFTRSGISWTQQAYLKASNTSTPDLFGTSLAISGDGSSLAVGASREDGCLTQGTQCSEAGAIYMFKNVGGVWSQDRYLKASNAENSFEGFTGDRFGNSIAISRDGTTLAGCAPWEDSGAPGVDGNQADNSIEHSGAAYVFR